MRIWSVHPNYLDAKGLVALWRETLLAKHVLEGKTKGYTQHPQLKRFKNTDNPLQAINQYLSVVFDEAKSRGYQFDESKIDWDFSVIKMTVTSGQINYERSHLLSKLAVRDESRYHELVEKLAFDPHPLFEVIDGSVEDWEIIS